MDLIRLKDKNELYAVNEVEEGQVVFVEDTEEYFLYQRGAWFPVQAEVTSEGLQLNLYELNRNIISQLPDFGDTQWEGAQQVVNTWMNEKTCKYFMLYGREINYFTIFKKNESATQKAEFETFFGAVRECLESLGPVRSISINELEDGSSSVEIWVKYEDVVTCMYLFEYEEGIVTYEQ